MENTNQSFSLDTIVQRDPRAGHFIVDIIAGTDPREAADRHFGTSPAQPDETVINEAENRGYLRGLNEAARQRLEAPALYEQLPMKPVPQQDPPEHDHALELFSEIPASIWDKI